MSWKEYQKTGAIGAETKKTLTLLIVDDERGILNTLEESFRDMFKVYTANSGTEALQIFRANEIQLVLSDQRMPEMTGAQLAGHARRVRPETVRILLTGKRSLETAIDGINQGEIFKFLNKPFDSEQLRGAVRSGVQRNRELVEMSGDRQRRVRRDALRNALEAEYPGISQVTRAAGEPYVVPSDPWKDAVELGLVGLSAHLEDGT